MEKLKTADSQRAVFANNLKFLLDRNGKTQTDMARDLNIAETTVSSWLKGKRYPRIDKIQMMADYFHVSRSQITEERPSNLMPVSPRTIAIPILGKIACGDPFNADENIEGYLYKSAEGLPSGELMALWTKGDSMTPTIPEGALVTVRLQKEAENGELVAVRINGDEDATLKRLKKQGNTILLMPDNRKYDPIIVTEDNPVSIIGKVVSYEVRF